MKIIDFFNSNPQYSIFQKETNKTYFGGILFILYIITMFIISLAYIVDYAINDKYEIESYIIDTYFDEARERDDNPLEIIKNNPDINPYVDFTVQVRLDDNIFHDNKTTNLSEIINNLLLNYKGKFIKGQFIYCIESIQEICIKFDINKQIIDLDLSFIDEVQLVYKCNDTILSNYPKNIFSHVAITTKDFKINHTSSIPFSSYDCTSFDNHRLCKHFAESRIHDNETLELDISVSSIVYEEKKGISRLFDKIFNKTNKHSISYIENERTTVYYRPDSYFYGEHYKEKEHGFEVEEEERDVNQTLYKQLAIINTFPVGKYQIYRRSEISFLTVLANIGALFSTFYSVFSFVFRFYSKNFDNYKIVEKILQLELTNNSKNKMQKNINFQNKSKNIELGELKFEKDNIISPLMDSFADNNNDKEENDKNKTDLIEEEKEDKNLKNEENKDKNIVTENKSKISPKLSFFDFYFNNFYFKCCKRKKKQDILDLCNSIKFKYISIDSVIYDLIRLENLFKDYKWNNPELYSLENNELIKKLMELI